MLYIHIDMATKKFSYPFSIGELRELHPNVSFPADMDDATLAEWGVYPVADTPMPDFNPLTHKLAEDKPVNRNGGWHQAYSIIPLSEADALIARLEAMTALKEERNARLTECDWTMLADAPITDAKKAEWKTYRQALRDFPETVTDLLNPNWPVQP